MSCEPLFPDFRDNYYLCGDPVDEDYFSHPPGEQVGFSEHPLNSSAEDEPTYLTMMDYTARDSYDAPDKLQSTVDSPPPVKQRYQANARERCRTQRCGTQRFLLFFYPGRFAL